MITYAHAFDFFYAKAQFASDADNPIKQ